MVLATPLIQEQLDAANRLLAHLRQWRVSDDALSALACAFPAWEPEAALLKVAWHGRELDRYLWLAGQYRA